RFRWHHIASNATSRLKRESCSTSKVWRRPSKVRGMNILAFDTCLGAVSVAVRWQGAGGDWLMRHAHEARERGHAERLIPMMTEVMEHAGLAFSDLHRIAVTVGP